MAQAEAIFTLSNGEKHAAKPTYNMIGRMNGYDVEAITPQGDLKTFHANLGEDTFVEKQKEGLMGNIERGLGINDKTIYQRHQEILRTGTPDQILAIERELFELRQKSIEAMAKDPNGGLVWDPDSRRINKLTPALANSFLQKNHYEAISKGTIAGNTAAKTLLPMQPSNPATGPANPGQTQGYFFSSQAEAPQTNRHQNSGRAQKGTIFGGFETETPRERVSERTVVTTQGTPVLHSSNIYADIAQLVALSQGASQNFPQDDPLYVSYAYRRELPQLNQDILVQEECSMSLADLFNAYKDPDLALNEFTVLGKTLHEQMGQLYELQDRKSKRTFIAKDLQPGSWRPLEVEVIRRMISTGPLVQEFLGFHVDPQDQSVKGIFESRMNTLPQFLSAGPANEEVVRAVLTGLIRSMAHLENLGLHHPGLHPGVVYLTANDLKSLRVSNPFLYEEFIPQVTTVYLNKYNSIEARATFNRQHLQHNVYQIFLVILSLILKTDYSEYESGQHSYNPRQIQIGLEALPRAVSPMTAELLTRYLTTPVSKLPTPIQLATQESMKIEQNSYFGLSRMNTGFYYPFKPFQTSKKVFVSKPQVKSRIPHHSEIDIFGFAGDDLEAARRLGIQHRRQNFIIVDDGTGKGVLRPYTQAGIDLADLPPEPTNMSYRQPARQAARQEPVAVRRAAPPAPVEEPPKPVAQYVARPQPVWREEPPQNDDIDHPTRVRQTRQSRPPVPEVQPENAYFNPYDHLFSQSRYE